MWDLPGPGIEPMSPALAGGFFATEPHGRSVIFFFFFLMWTFFKAFLKFVTISLLFYVFVFGCEGMWDLSFLTRAQTHARCIGWGSLNHWTTREDPLFHLLSFLFNLEFPNSFPNSYHPLRVPNKLVIPWILQIFISQTVIRSHICINSFLIQKAAFGCC